MPKTTDPIPTTQHNHNLMNRRSAIGLFAGFLVTEALVGCTREPQAVVVNNPTTADKKSTQEPFTFSLTVEQQSTVAKLEAMEFEEFATQPLKQRALWAVDLFASLRNGYPSATFDKVLVPAHVGANAKTLRDGNPIDHPHGRHTDVQDLGIISLHNAALIYGIQRNMSNQQDPGPYDLPRAKKCASAFFVDPTSPVYKQILGEIEQQKAPVGIDVNRWQSLAVIGDAEEGEYTTKDGLVLPSTTITYQPPNNSHPYRSTKAFVEMGDICGKAPNGEPAGLWFEVGNVR